MWRSLLRSIDRFSLQYFKSIINELREIKVVDKHNKELVVDLLQSIVELVTYGDKQDPLIFECFMEYQVLAELVRLLKISRNSRIEGPLLQYLSIMIQNMDSEHAIYYCFSNDYINSIIEHHYEFGSGDLALYYVSFLRAVSSKINRDTLCLLVKVHGDSVVSFPLFREALKFAQHGDKMIQTAIRALTLSICNVSDDMVCQYITTPPVSKYFSDLVDSLRQRCFHLDNLVHATGEKHIQDRRKEILLETHKIIDDLYYIKDLITISKSHLNSLIVENLLNILVFPLLPTLLQLRQTNDSNLSATTSLYFVSRLLQVVGGKSIINLVAGVILYSYMTLNMRSGLEGDATFGVFPHYSFLDHLSEINKMLPACSQSEGSESISGNYWFGHLEKYISLHSHSHNFSQNIVPIERFKVLSHISSDNQRLLLASLFLLLTVVESKDLDSSLLTLGGSNGRWNSMIFDELLTNLASKSLPIIWHTGWFLRKLLTFQGKRLYNYNIDVFNKSYEKSREHFQKELDGCWFDYMPDALKIEWANCKAALEESSQCKDPFFVIDPAISQLNTNGDPSSFTWKRMVDSVKVFVLHLHLMALISNDGIIEETLVNMMRSSSPGIGRNRASDISSAGFGSEVSLGSGVACRIAFSNAGIRDIYVIPVAKEMTGNLLLVEKLPFYGNRGVVIAIAPLAGLSPTIDEDHLTWLHLRVREYSPRSNTGKARVYDSKMSNQSADGRWTLGFSDAKTCEAARLLILEEICKQRSFVESVLAPLLHYDYHAPKFSDKSC